MNMQNISKSAYAMIFILLSSASSTAGEVVEMVTKQLNNPDAQAQVMQFLFSDGFMKMQDSEDTEMIFSSADQNMMIISHAEKSYMVFDQNTGSAVKNEMEKAMEAAMAQVPPEQRAMVEQMMKQRMQGMGGPQTPPQMETPKMEINRTSRSETINGYDCTFYEASRNGQKENEYCVASWSELGVSDDIQQSFEGMSEFMEGFLEQFREMAPIQTQENPFTYMKEIGGFPVLNRQFSNGTPTQETILSSIDERDIDNAIFGAPQGYNKQGLMGR